MCSFSLNACKVMIIFFRNWPEYIKKAFTGPTDSLSPWPVPATARPANPLAQSPAAAQKALPALSPRQGPWIGPTGSTDGLSKDLRHEHKSCQALGPETIPVHF